MNVNRILLTIVMIPQTVAARIKRVPKQGVFSIGTVIIL